MHLFTFGHQAWGEDFSAKVSSSVHHIIPEYNNELDTGSANDVSVNISQLENADCNYFHCMRSRTPRNKIAYEIVVTEITWDVISVHFCLIYTSHVPFGRMDIACIPSPHTHPTPASSFMMHNCPHNSIVSW